MAEGISLKSLSERLSIEKLIIAGVISVDDLQAVEMAAEEVGIPRHGDNVVLLARSLTTGPTAPCHRDAGFTIDDPTLACFASHGNHPNKLVVRSATDWFAIARFEFTDMATKLKGHLDGTSVVDSFNDLPVPEEVFNRIRMIVDRPALGGHLYATASEHFAISLLDMLSEIPGMRKLNDQSLLWSIFTNSHEDMVAADWLSISGVSPLAHSLILGVPQELVETS